MTSKWDVGRVVHERRSVSGRNGGEDSPPPVLPQTPRDWILMCARRLLKTWTIRKRASAACPRAAQRITERMKDGAQAAGRTAVEVGVVGCRRGGGGRGGTGFWWHRRWSESMAEKQAHRTAAPSGDDRGVSINPASAVCRVRGFRMLEREGGATAVSFASLYANVEAESLLRGGVVVQEVKLVEPMLSVVRVEGTRLNWSDLIDEILNKPDDGSKSQFAVHNIRVGRAASTSTTGRQRSATRSPTSTWACPSSPINAVGGQTFVRALAGDEGEWHALRNPRQSHALLGQPQSVVDLQVRRPRPDPLRRLRAGGKTFRLPSARLSSAIGTSFAQPAGQPAKA